MKSTARLTNSQSTLADKAGAAINRYKKLNREAVAAYVEAGHYLIEAKAGCEHGEFGAVVERSGIARSTATRAMKIAFAVGTDPEQIATVNNFGIRGTLELIEHAEAWEKNSFGERAVAEIGGPFKLMVLLAVSGRELVKLASKIADEIDPDDAVNGTILCLQAKLKYETDRGQGPFDTATD